jgi:hypothetical protein
VPERPPAPNPPPPKCTDEGFGEIGIPALVVLLALFALALIAILVT